LVSLTVTKPLTPEERLRIERWLRVRVKVERVKLIVES